MVPCLVIPGMSSNVRVLSEGRQNAYDSTRASSPILQHTSIVIKIYKNAQYTYKYKGESNLVKL